MKALSILETLELPNHHTILEGDEGAGAIFSEPNRDYRYLLWRKVGHSTQTCLFIMLNPSVAGALRLDPTVAKCIHWAKDWGFGRLEVANIFAYVSTDPTPIRKGHNGIVGPDNDRYIKEALDRADRVIVAWGNYGTVLKRGDEVLKLIEDTGRSAWCFGVTKTKQPRHPVRLAYATKLVHIDRATYGPIS